MLSENIDLLLTSDTEAPSVARRSLDGVKEFLSTRQFEDVRLLVTELVTNSVLHASQDAEGGIRLLVTASVEGLRVEVSDPGPGFDKPSFWSLSADDVRGGSPFSSGTEQGRGLYLVERLSDRWGVVLDGATCVWFEINRASPYDPDLYGDGRVG